MPTSSFHIIWIWQIVISLAAHSITILLYKKESNDNKQRVHQCFSLIIDFIDKENTERSAHSLYYYSATIVRNYCCVPCTPSWFNLLEMRAQNVFILFRVHLLTRHHFHFSPHILLFLFSFTFLAHVLVWSLVSLGYDACVYVGSDLYVTFWFDVHIVSVAIIPCRSTS